MKFGMQMFGAAQAFRADPEKFFEKISGLGYEYIEPCVFFGENVPSFGEGRAVPFWTVDEVKKYNEDMKKYGQSIISAHVFCADYDEALPMMAEVAKCTGLRAYVINVPAPAIEDPDKYGAVYSKLAENLSEIGVELWLHNSGNDFRNKMTVNGKEMPIYEYLLEKSEGAYAQVDTGWVYVGGIKAEDFMKEHIEKVKCIHFKDLHEGLDELGAPQMFAVLGTGITDIKACLSIEDEDESIPVIIDQDMAISGDIFQDMADSMEAIKAVWNVK